jgi:hypothetical protein
MAVGERRCKSEAFTGKAVFVIGRRAKSRARPLQPPAMLCLTFKGMAGASRQRLLVPRKPVMPFALLLLPHGSSCVPMARLFWPTHKNQPLSPAIGPPAARVCAGLRAVAGL